MKWAVIQMRATEEKEANVAKAQMALREAAFKGAEAAALPEIFSFRGNLYDAQVRKEVAEPLTGATITGMRRLAQELKMGILVGSYIEKSSETRVYNTSVWIDDKGKIAAKYRKIHLFDANIGDKIIRESACFLRGQKTTLTTVASFKMGLSICFDVRFSDMYQKYRRQGADILTVPACFTKKTGEAHWEALLRARAIESLAYVIAPNQYGMDVKGVAAYGHSMIIDPWGRILARASGDKDEIIYADIHRQAIKEARLALPGLAKAVKD